MKKRRGNFPTILLTLPDSRLSSCFFTRRPSQSKARFAAHLGPLFAPLYFIHQQVFQWGEESNLDLKKSKKGPHPISGNNELLW